MFWRYSVCFGHDLPPTIFTGGLYRKHPQPIRSEICVMVRGFAGKQKVWAISLFCRRLAFVRNCIRLQNGLDVIAKAYPARDFLRF
jgi:hypothetical protein